VTLSAAILALLSLPGVHNAIGILHAHCIGVIDRDDQEYSAVVENTGKFHIRADPASSMEAPVSIDAHTVLIIHTHPNNAIPTPSAHDIAVARQTGIPDLIISQHEEWIVTPDGSTTKIQ
jgi:proteasome lid subunit RPN8/RPN11